MNTDQLELIRLLLIEYRDMLREPTVLLNQCLFDSIIERIVILENYHLYFL